MPYTQQQMFDLVLDVNSYASFIPNIKKNILSHFTDRGFQAQLFLKTPPVSYTSFVTYKPGHICARSNTFPLKYLQADWFFKETPLHNCQIIFELKADFLLPFIDTCFHSIAKSMMNAFEQEAKRRYSL